MKNKTHTSSIQYIENRVRLYILVSIVISMKKSVEQTRKSIVQCLCPTTMFDVFQNLCIGSQPQGFVCFKLNHKISHICIVISSFARIYIRSQSSKEALLSVLREDTVRSNQCSIQCTKILLCKCSHRADGLQSSSHLLLLNGSFSWGVDFSSIMFLDQDDSDQKYFD